MSSGKILRNAHGSPGGGWASNCATYVETERTWAPGALAPVVAFAAAVPSGSTATARASAASERLILMGPPSCAGARLPSAGRGMDGPAAWSNGTLTGVKARRMVCRLERGPDTPHDERRARHGPVEPRHAGPAEHREPLGRRDHELVARRDLPDRAARPRGRGLADDRERPALGERRRDVVADHVALVGERQPFQRDAREQRPRRAPRGSTVGRRDEPGRQLARARAAVRRRV